MARTIATFAAAYVALRLLPQPADGRGRGRIGGADRGPRPVPEPPPAETPADIAPHGWFAVGKRVYQRISEDRLMAVAAGVTFYALLALFPAIAALVSIFGLVADPATISDQLAALGSFMPGGAIDIVGEQVKRIASRPGALGIGFAIGLASSLWSTNAGMKAMFDALNVASGERETRSFIRLNLVSLAFTLGAVLFLVVALSALVVLPVAFNMLGLGGIGPLLVWIGRWPALFLVIVLALALLYRFGPNLKAPRWRWLTPGSLLAALGWSVFSVAFSWYVSSFGAYNQTYGSLGAAIGFMTWIWLSAAIILIGAEVNAEAEREAAVR